jgi:hypothetical protein
MAIHEKFSVDGGPSGVDTVIIIVPVAIVALGKGASNVPQKIKFMLAGWGRFCNPSRSYIYRIPPPR